MSRHQFVCLGLLLGVATELPAQPAPPARSFCWTAKPLSQCRTTALGGISLLLPVAGASLGENLNVEPPTTGVSIAGAADAGILRNLNEKWGVGLGAYLLGFEDTRVGLIATGRRWLTPDLALDMAPGLTVAYLGEGWGSGFTGRLGITWREWIGMDAWIDAPHFRASLVGWYLGVRVGTGPGPVVNGIVWLLAALGAGLTTFEMGPMMY